MSPERRAPAKSYAAILDAVEDRLRSGQLRIGDRLPSERALAEEFGISRNSVREAIRILDALGLVRSGVGSGPSAGAIVISEPSAALGWGLRMHLASSFLPVVDVVAVRRLLEADAAAAAAARREAASDPEAGQTLASAAEILDALDDPDLPDETFHELDAQFHLTITSLGGNEVTTTILGSLRQATVGYVQEGVRLLTDWPQVRLRLQEQHRQILAAVAGSDPPAAAAAVSAHVEWFYRMAFEHLEG
ncbi:FadR/GntR family transcriptional regulator [Brevibacterium luteolum]|uniref:FadR/GntR family transcriptional regulator n=1 Tax=Brevibacterium luteolum TaxID=199591 RepID=UPI001C246088|nr:GntR family transcriptional regulator [Brevibacterium luteolum]MBU8578974.1 GntR family transcriptional regulator [Brevibacterium luteolum]